MDVIFPLCDDGVFNVGTAWFDEKSFGTRCTLKVTTGCDEAPTIFPLCDVLIFDGLIGRDEAPVNFVFKNDLVFNVGTAWFDEKSFLENCFFNVVIGCDEAPVNFPLCDDIVFKVLTGWEFTLGITLS